MVCLYITYSKSYSIRFLRRHLKITVRNRNLYEAGVVVVPYQIVVGRGKEDASPEVEGEQVLVSGQNQLINAMTDFCIYYCYLVVCAETGYIYMTNVQAVAKGYTLNSPKMGACRPVHKRWG